MRMGIVMFMIARLAYAQTNWVQVTGDGVSLRANLPCNRMY